MAIELKNQIKDNSSAFESMAESSLDFWKSEKEDIYQKYFLGSKPTCT